MEQKFAIAIGLASRFIYSRSEVVISESDPPLPFFHYFFLLLLNRLSRRIQWIIRALAMDKFMMGQPCDIMGDSETEPDQSKTKKSWILIYWYNMLLGLEKGRMFPCHVKKGGKLFFYMHHQTIFPAFA